MTNRKRGRPKLKYNNFTVKFSLDAYLKIKRYCELAGTDEWLGFLLRDNERTNENTIVIADVYFPPQTIGGANCELKAGEFADEIGKLISTKEGRDMMPRFCGWIHSHCDMQVFFSATDVEANSRMRQYMAESKIFISAVVNNELKFLGKGIIKTNGKDYEVDDVVFGLDYAMIDKINKRCDKDFKKATKEIAVPLKHYYYGHGPKEYVYVRSPKIPKKYRKSLEVKTVSKIIIAENKCIAKKNLAKSIKYFIKNHKGRFSKPQKKTIDFIFRGLYMRKFTELEAFEIFGKDYKKPVRTKNNIVRDSQYRPINKSGWKTWEDNYGSNEITVEEYERQKLWEEENQYGY